MKPAKSLTYIFMLLISVPTVYALEMQNFFNAFGTLADFFKNSYVLFFLLIIGTGTVFGLLYYFALSRTPLADMPNILRVLSFVLAAMSTIPILFAVRNKNIITFMEELFSGFFGTAIGFFVGFVAFLLVYWITNSLWSEP